MIVNKGNSYPVLTEYGVVMDGAVSITYPENVKKLYSEDGENWKEYTGEFESNASTIYAKAVKDSGLEIVVNAKKTGLASDALGVNAYDNDNSTYDYFTTDNPKKIYVSSEMQGKSIIVNVRDLRNNGAILVSCNENAEETTLCSYSGTAFNGTVALPEDSKYLKFKKKSLFAEVAVYEIAPDNAAVIENKKYYPILTEYGIEPGYNEIEIKYFQTSVQKLYKINDGEWKNYTGKVRIEIGETIYAKGIDKNNKETRVITEYIAELPTDALGEKAYDNDSSTYDYFTGDNLKRIYISPEAQGKTIVINVKDTLNNGGTLVSYNENEKATTLCSYSGTAFNGTIVLPEDSKYLKFLPKWSSFKVFVYEINIKK